LTGVDGLFQGQVLLLEEFLDCVYVDEAFHHLIMKIVLEAVVVAEIAHFGQFPEGD